jgi:mannan endo-1,4-beta-mannosidase
MKNFKYILLCAILIGLSFNNAFSANNLFVDGRFLYTPCGEKVILRGVNKMIIFTGDVDLRKQSYTEIRKTGANCIRIVWLAHPTDQVDATPAGLERNIQDCIDNNMIPMVELHDATGEWSMLPDMVDYWVSPEVVSVVKKHEKYLIINIGNEIGNEQVTNDQFKSGYITAVNRIRDAGIHTPLVIDAAEWGKNLDMLVSTGQELLNADPDHNLIFSVHMYWAISDGADAAYILNKLKESVDAGIPLIVGEFTYKFNTGTVCDNDCDYQSILKDCNDMELGWLAWEWGPGNGYYDKSCDIMDMTSNSNFNTLKDGWASVVAVTSPYSIVNTSVTPKYIMQKGSCDSISNVTDYSFKNISLDIFPNPMSENATISFNLVDSRFISLKLFNALGELIGTIDEGYLFQGLHYYELPKSMNLNSGTYFCRISDGIETNSKIITVIR